jgi:hypothetical protein
MSKTAAVILVFIGGFIIMVLEIIGARFLAKDFGSSFHVWVSQIGVVLIALALGYYLGGALADRWQRPRHLVTLLVPAGLLLWLIPHTAAWMIERIVTRHPVGQPVPMLWHVALHDSLGDSPFGTDRAVQRIYHRGQHGRQHRRSFRLRLRADRADETFQHLPPDGWNDHPAGVLVRGFRSAIANQSEKFESVNE